MKDKDKDILKRLKGSGPGFSLPKGYFDDLDKSLASLGTKTSQDQGSDNHKSHLTESSSILDQKKFGPGFRVPENYFDSFEAKALNTELGKVVSLGNKTRRIISLAIAASILLFFGIQYNYNLKPAATEVSFQEADVSNWIEMDLVEFNTYEIAEVFDDIELDAVAYTDEELFSYLNEVDLENIILEN